jgi:hypothetical protein
MERIDFWKMDDIGAVSEHLKECPYNVKNDHINATKRTKDWDIVMEKISKFDITQGLKSNNH